MAHEDIRTPSTAYPRRVEEIEARVLEGYYECPVPVTVDTAALTIEYTTVIADQAVVLRLPSANGVSQSRNELSAPQWHYTEREDLLSARPELAPFWGRIVIWTDNYDAPKAADVRRVGISLTVDGDDDTLRDTGRRLAEAMPAWWAAVSAWIEILHGQDLSRLGSVEPGIKFSGATLWSRLYRLHGHPLRGGALLPVGSSIFGLVWPNFRAISAHQLQRCIDHGDSFGPPPTEWLILRDASSLCAGHDYRRGVLDAGLAAELAVTTLIRTHLTASGHADVEGELRRNSMLGRLSKYWIEQCGGTLPTGYRTRLIDKRNAATHVGSQLFEADARDAITVAREILCQATPLPT